MMKPAEKTQFQYSTALTVLITAWCVGMMSVCLSDHMSVGASAFIAGLPGIVALIFLIISGLFPISDEQDKKEP